MKFELSALPYDYNALEPVIDEQTMQLHHDKHHQAYVNNLNAAIDGLDLAYNSVKELLEHISELPADKQQAVINNGGGHYNHTLFWETMTPGGASEPSGDLAKKIDETFGSFDEFKKAFEAAGAKQFGSGWVWLVEKDDKLEVIATKNQDSPVMDGYTVLLGNDVWEHAYYVTYQNRRADYLSAWWKVVNWDVVASRLV